MDLHEQRARLTAQRSRGVEKAARRLDSKRRERAATEASSSLPHWVPCQGAEEAQKRFQETLDAWFAVKASCVDYAHTGEDRTHDSAFHLLQELGRGVQILSYQELHGEEPSVNSSVLLHFRGNEVLFKFAYRAEPSMIGSRTLLAGKVELYYTTRGPGGLVPLYICDTRRRGDLGLPQLGCLPVEQSVQKLAAQAKVAFGRPEMRYETEFKYDLGLSVPKRLLGQPTIQMSELWLLVAVACAPQSYHEQLFGMLLSNYDQDL